MPDYRSATPAPEMIVKLPVGMPDHDLGPITHVKLSRFTSKERRDFETAFKNKEGLEYTRGKMVRMVRGYGKYDFEDKGWTEGGMIVATDEKVLNGLDMFDEDFLFEMVIAHEYGYGTLEEWRNSEGFRALSGADRDA